MKKKKRLQGGFSPGQPGTLFVGLTLEIAR
jgi:hypothetical protein